MSRRDGPPSHTPGRQKAGGSARTATRAGALGLKQHVKTAHKRSHASTQWLQRQLNDPYVARAKAEGWRSRAAYKLIEIDDQARLLKRGQTIVDLGAAPGGWAQVAALRTGAREGAGRVIAIDLLPIEPIAGVTFAEVDFTAEDAPAKLHAMLERRDSDPPSVDGVVSDMAANTTGHRATDHLKIIALAELAADFATAILKTGGFFLCKLFQGGETAALVTALKRDFRQVRHMKPQASRADSSEVYLLATGFRGRGP